MIDNLTDKQLKDNILEVYKNASRSEKARGSLFYSQAAVKVRHMAALFSTTDEMAAGVIAALSPNVDWKRNLVQAAEFIAADWQRKPIMPEVGAYGAANQAKAARILRGEDPYLVLGGPRVRGLYEA